MADVIAPFDHHTLSGLADILQDSMTHRDLTEAFTRLRLPQVPEGSKRDRLEQSFALAQARDGNANTILAFIADVLAPTRFVQAPENFRGLRVATNKYLAFHGLALLEDGRLSRVHAVRTLSELEERASHFRKRLLHRGVHGDVLAFCRPELLQENYFHAVFEATKSVADKMREKTGLSGSGTDLVDAALGLDSNHLPILAINTCRTEIERNEQTGFASLVKGMFGTFHDVTSHVPKVKWPIDEEDALDLLSLASYIHRRLDKAVRTHRSSQ